MKKVTDISDKRAPEKYRRASWHDKRGASKPQAGYMDPTRLSPVNWIPVDLSLPWPEPCVDVSDDAPENNPVIGISAAVLVTFIMDGDSPEVGVGQLSRLQDGRETWAEIGEKEHANTVVTHWMPMPQPAQG